MNNYVNPLILPGQFKTYENFQSSSSYQVQNGRAYINGTTRICIHNDDLAKIRQIFIDASNKESTAEASSVSMDLMSEDGSDSTTATEPSSSCEALSEMISEEGKKENISKLNSKKRKATILTLVFGVAASIAFVAALILAGFVVAGVLASAPISIPLLVGLGLTGGVAVILFAAFLGSGIYRATI